MLTRGADYIETNGLCQNGGYFADEESDNPRYDPMENESRPACAVGACAATAGVDVTVVECMLHTAGLDIYELQRFNDNAASASVVTRHMRKLAGEL